MKNVFESIDKDGTIEDMEKRSSYALNNLDKSLNEITNKFILFEKEFNKNTLNEIYLLLNSFSDENVITQRIILKLLESYCKNISDLISKNMWEIIELFIDVFYHNSNVFRLDSSNAKLFFDSSISLLLIEKSNSLTSEKEIATEKLIRLLSNKQMFTDDNSLQKFKDTHPRSPYFDDI